MKNDKKKRRLRQQTANRGKEYLLNMTIPQYIIAFNSEFERWEVYTKGCVKRAGEIQPLFVSTDIMECDAYIARREALA